jgi:hypothetical protein
MSFTHLTPNPFPRNASYFETLRLYSFSPWAMALDPDGLDDPERVEVQYIDPA